MISQTISDSALLESSSLPPSLPPSRVEFYDEMSRQESSVDTEGEDPPEQAAVAVKVLQLSGLTVELGSTDVTSERTEMEDSHGVCVCVSVCMQCVCVCVCMQCVHAVCVCVCVHAVCACMHVRVCMHTLNRVCVCMHEYMCMHA